MKKIALFLLIILYGFQIKAKTYYSNYSNFMMVEDKIEETDLVKLKIEEKYLVYKEETLEEFYPSYMKIDDMTKTSEEKIITSDWLDSKPEILPDRKIIEKELYEYQDMKKIRYIKLTDLINSSSTFDISEIKIYKKGERVNYDALSDIKDISKIKDDLINNFISFNKNDEILIDLKEDIDITDLNVMYHIHIKDSASISFTINLLGQEKEKIYAKSIIKSNLNIENGTEFSYLIGKDHFKLNDPVYENSKLSEKEVIKTTFRDVKMVTKYKTEDLYIKYYKILRQYLPDYYETSFDDYKVDFDSKKEFYYIKKRDKVEMADNLVIDKYDIKLEDFILNTTLENIKITSNVNYYKNGEYSINFILPFKTVKEKLIVDIKENYKNALKKQNESLKELEKYSQKLFINNNKLNIELKEVLKNKDEIVNRVNEKLLKYKYENEMLKKNKQEIHEDIENNNYHKYKFFLIFLIILIVLFLTLYERKKSTQNNI